MHFLRLSAISGMFIALGAFSFAPSLVPRDEILPGGPPKDGIPALTRPAIESAAQANRWLDDSDMILGIEMNKQSRAYPLRILNWHEIANDRIAGKKIVITYCPLCGSGMAFDSDDEFAVSGLLYQSDVLLYDRKTETLWSQLMMRAVAGIRSGETLKTLPVTHTTWRAWRNLHPETTVLSRHTGYRRDYSRDPYAGYAQNPALIFPVRHQDERLHAKTWVIGVETAHAARAWKIDDIRKLGELNETWNGQKIVIRYQNEAVTIRDQASGQQLNSVVLYWFAWAAFHPQTSLFMPR
ncbi:MAG: DUF3179 domain-containing protein [Mariprofundaceae bacterium]|nr:DUF3179 domain-containing protein [Mariprofundaceae bacterium]